MQFPRQPAYGEAKLRNWTGGAATCFELRNRFGAREEHGMIYCA